MELEELSVLTIGDSQNGGALDAGSPRGTLAWTSLQFACALGDEDLITSLLVDAKSSALDTGKTRYGYTPLHIAVHFGHALTVKQLLAVATSAGAAAIDSQIGGTALHLAVLNGNIEIVRMLLEAGVKHTPTKNGTTPLDLAKELEHTELSQLLTDHIKKASGKAQIGNWLASIGMVEYAANFQDAGFDDAAFLLASGLSEAALDAMKIEKPGHRMKLQGLYQLKESIPELNDDEEEEVSGSDSDDSDDEESGSSAEDSDESGSEGSKSEEGNDKGDSSE